MIVNHGEKVKYYHEIVGCNSRLDSIQAEILNIKLNYLNEYNLNRKSMADNYNTAFKNLENVEIPKVIKNSSHVYHQYTLKVKNKSRNLLKKYLFEHGIPSMVYYPVPIHKQKAYYSNQILTNTELISEEVISLPVHTEIHDSNQDYIINKVIKFFKK